MSKKAGTALSLMAMVFMGALASPLTVLAAGCGGRLISLLCMLTIWALLPPLVSDHPCADHKKRYTASVCGNCSRSTDLFPDLNWKEL